MTPGRGPARPINFEAAGAPPGRKWQLDVMAAEVQAAQEVRMIAGAGAAGVPAGENSARLADDGPPRPAPRQAGRQGRGSGRARGRAEESGGIISLSKAAALYREVTGRRKSLKVLADILHERPHLAVFDFDLTSCRPHFLGVRRDRWLYFLKTRYLMYGSRDIFHSNEL